MLITNPRRKEQIEEFIDQDHAVMREYYEIYDDKTSWEDAIELMHKLMKKDPNFFDPFHLVVDDLFEKGKKEEAAALLKDSYARAIKIIVDSKGRWPKKMIWGFMANRHIMRIIDRYAMYCWETGNIDEALTIFRQLLKVNPMDNLGARHNILAIKMGFSFDELNKRFGVKEDGVVVALDGIKLGNWFATNVKKFPEEFKDYFVFVETLE